MPDISLLMIFMIGFLGGVHCIGMCGGLSSAFALQLPPNVSRFQLIVLLNSGRITSYTIIGLLLGAVGQWGSMLDATDTLRRILFVASQLILLFLGLYLAGISTQIVHIESIGKPIWKHLNPLLTHLLPLKSAKSTLLAGMLWGWLPCGLVYSASTYALSSGNALQGGLIMLLFGLGTLPNLLVMGFFATTLQGFLRRRWVQFIVGGLVSTWALWQLWHFRW